MAGGANCVHSVSLDDQIFLVECMGTMTFYYSNLYVSFTNPVFAYIYIYINATLVCD